MLNVNTNSRLTPDGFRPRNSRLVVKPLSKLSFSVRHDPPRSFPRNSLDRMRSLLDLAHTPSPYDFWTVFALYTRYSTSQCWSQPFRTLFPIKSSLPHLRPWSMMNQNLRSPRYWIPRSTTVDVPANYCTLSIGQAMKAQTKKPHGLVLGKFGLVRSRAIFAGPEPGQSGPRCNFWDWDRDRQGPSRSVWSRSRPGPDGPWW